MNVSRTTLEIGRSCPVTIPGALPLTRNAVNVAWTFLVSGRAPGMVTGHERPISNVVRETFTIGG